MSSSPATGIQAESHALLKGAASAPDATRPAPSPALCNPCPNGRRTKPANSCNRSGIEPGWQFAFLATTPEGLIVGDAIFAAEAPGWGRARFDRFKRDGNDLILMPPADEETADAEWRGQRHPYSKGVRFRRLSPETAGRVREARQFGIRHCTSLDQLLTAHADVAELRASFGLARDRAIAIEEQFRRFPDRRRARNLMAHCALLLRAEARHLAGGTRIGRRKAA